MSESLNYPMVYLYDEGILGELLQYHAHASLIRYEEGGVEHEVLVLNEDFEIIDELYIGIDEYDE